MVGKLKKGQESLITSDQRRRSAPQPFIAVTDFAKAMTVPPTDPKVLEEQQKKLQDELQRRAEEARKTGESAVGRRPAGCTCRSRQIAPRFRQMNRLASHRELSGSSQVIVGRASQPAS